MMFVPAPAPSIHHGPMQAAGHPRPSGPGVGRWFAKMLDRGFGALSLVVVLSVIATVPVLQLLALGYLLYAARRVVHSGKLREAFVGIGAASRLGQWLLGTWLWTLPWRLASSLHADALLIDPTGPNVIRMESIATLLGWAALTVSLLALMQGGQLIHFLRPIRATRRLIAQVREPGRMAERLRVAWQMVRDLPLLNLLWLGLRGYVGAALLLAIPTTLIAIGRKSPLVLPGAVLLVALLLYLPYLQIHFAAHDKLTAMVDIRAIRHAFARAPLAFMLALASTLTLALPLYLLKIELVPRDAMWLPASIFVVTIFPTKLICAWAYRRGIGREEPAHALWRWLARAMMLPIAVGYAFIVFLTQYTGWHGLWGLYEHHAFLLPVPF